MTLQINTTTVIDASRNLSNIANQGTFTREGSATVGVGNIGSLTWAWSSLAAGVYGTTVAGSTLTVAGWTTISGIASLAANASTGGNRRIDGMRSIGSHTGTWRRLGDTTGSNNQWCLYIRIS